MSIQGLGLVRKILSAKLNSVSLIIRNVSRRSNYVDGPYKVVKSRKINNDNAVLLPRNPNLEILAPTNGYPYFMPGHCGPAWYDTQTTVQTRHEFIMEQIDNNVDSEENIICRVQVCPTVLRQTVCDLFPYRNFENSELSIVTIILKPDLKHLRKNNEIETEKMAQTFVLAAKNICDKLRRGGYWADFINPFSGRPYLFRTAVNSLYETDEKFRCLGFQIFEIQDCKIISNETDKSARRFIGSLFTNAPSKKQYLNHIFTE